MAAAAVDAANAAVEAARENKDKTSDAWEKTREAMRKCKHEKNDELLDNFDKSKVLHLLLDVGQRRGRLNLVKDALRQLLCRSAWKDAVSADEDVKSKLLVFLKLYPDMSEFVVVFEPSLPPSVAESETSASTSAATGAGSLGGDSTDVAESESETQVEPETSTSAAMGAGSPGGDSTDVVESKSETPVEMTLRLLREGLHAMKEVKYQYVKVVGEDGASTAFRSFCTGANQLYSAYMKNPDTFDIDAYRGFFNELTEDAVPNIIDFMMQAYRAYPALKKKAFEAVDKFSVVCARFRTALADRRGAATWSIWSSNLWSAVPMTVDGLGSSTVRYRLEATKGGTVSFQILGDGSWSKRRFPASGKREMLEPGGQQSKSTRGGLLCGHGTNWELQATPSSAFDIVYDLEDQTVTIQAVRSE
eukprot:TRINITY_DN90947_c0_g1_i1.p1 TRINITY_DN90947_c0_g1~~TRINITY_DN90947_c0_g1_i1.p1  ORF type:complete len:419 (+),score=86.81 TRINITY_DN90947_c0_g1_i1:83-1339(+)